MRGLFGSTQLYSLLYSTHDSTLLHPTLPRSNRLYLFCPTLPCSIHYCTLPYSTLLSPTLPYSTLLYSTLPYPTLLYFTPPRYCTHYSTLLYSTLLYSFCQGCGPTSFQVLLQTSAIEFLQCAIYNSTTQHVGPMQNFSRSLEVDVNLNKLIRCRSGRIEAQDLIAMHVDSSDNNMS